MNTDKMSEENRFRTFGETLNLPGHRIYIQPPVSPQQTARIEKNHCPQHFLDLRPLPQGQGWLRTYFDICGKAPGETFSPEEFNARKPRWNQWVADRRTD